MKKFRIILLLFILVQVSGIYNVSAQTPSTQGKKFWVTFMQNHTYKSIHYSSLPNGTLSLMISAKKACSGTIKNPYTGYNIPFTVSSGGLKIIDLYAPECYSVSSDVIEQKGLLVEATDTISLFASNYQDRSFDISNIMPVDALQDEYMLQTYTSPNGFNGSEFVVIATEDNTTVDITPNVDTKGGHLGGQTYSITLNEGETYQVQTRTNYDEFSGTIIKARDCKKIAVLNGNQITQVPLGYNAGDHIFEQAMPTAYWGTKFAITSTAERTRDIVKITALRNNTTIKKNGETIATIQSGQTYEFELISKPDNSCFLETSQPCAVYLYLVGVCYDAVGTANAFCCSSNCGIGDPSMLWISPIEQKIKEITFGTYQTYEIQTHYVNIVVATDDAANVTLDGANISSRFSKLAGNEDLSFARVKISHGTHTLKCDDGLIAHVYGLGYRESYAYSVGSATEDLNRTFWINDNPFSADLYAVKKVCILDSTKFYLSTDYAYDNVSWDFGDGGKASGDTVYHNYTADGTYTVTAIVQRFTTNCFGSLIDTIIADIKTTTHVPTTTLHDTICYGQQYDRYNFKLKATKDITVIDTITTMGCDSIVTLNLKVCPIYNDTIRATICLGTQYNLYGFDTIPKNIGTITYSQNLTSVNGCDSITTLILGVKSEYNDTTKINLCQGETYAFSGNIYSTSGLYTENLTSAFGCDSIVTLDLTVNPTYNRIIDAEIRECDFYEFDGKKLRSEGTYNGQLKTTNGCDSIVTLNLRVKDLSNITAFSPFNKDGINDYFMAGHEIQVFNRQGNLIYETKTDEQKTRGWDGTNKNGENVEPGIYFYIVFDNETFAPCVKNSVEVLKK